MSHVMKLVATFLGPPGIQQFVCVMYIVRAYFSDKRQRGGRRRSASSWWSDTGRQRHRRTKLTATGDCRIAQGSIMVQSSQISLPVEVEIILYVSLALHQHIGIHLPIIVSYKPGANWDWAVSLVSYTTTRSV